MCHGSHLGLEEADGDAVVLQAVDPQLAAAWRLQLLSGDEFQQTDQNHAGLQLSVDVSQLQVLLRDHRIHFHSNASNRHFNSSDTTWQLVGVFFNHVFFPTCRLFAFIMVTSVSGNYDNIKVSC